MLQIIPVRTIATVVPPIIAASSKFSTLEAFDVVIALIVAYVVAVVITAATGIALLRVVIIISETWFSVTTLVKAVEVATIEMIITNN